MPRIVAPDDLSLFIAYGVAQAQDRLFQMDLRRRLGLGTMAALIGPDGLVRRSNWRERSACTSPPRREVRRLDRATRSLLEAFAEGVNAVIEARRGCEPIEYGLLGMTPEPWTALDSAACAMSWRWQLTGRMHVIAAPGGAAPRARGRSPLVGGPRCVPGGRRRQHRAEREPARRSMPAACRPLVRPRTPAATTGSSPAPGARPASRSSPAIRTCPTRTYRRSTRSACTAARSTRSAPA